jgi:hypothetical protein
MQSMDYSFIKLSKTIDSENPKISQINYSDCVQLLPSESYLQISNNADGIAFDNDFAVFVVDCENISLADITTNVSIFEFTDINGVHQIAFEINFLNVDFGFQPVRLKFVKTTGSDIWYSNEILITEEAEEQTTRFDYKANGYFQGISYDIVDYYQSIRLRCFFDRLDNETEVKDYYQISKGNTISTRALLKEVTNYKFVNIDPFVFKRINVLLIHDIIYVDGLRMTNKTNVKGSERLGYSNLSEGEFSAYINNNDLFTFDYQIYEGLKIIENNPVGQISLYAFFNEISFSLNKPVTVNPIASLINLKDGLGNILFSYDYLDLSFDGVYYNIDTSAFIPAIGSYTVEIPKGLFSSTLQTTDFYSWTFNIVTGDYSDSDYSSDYLI